MAIFIPKMKRHSEPEFCFCFFPPPFFIFKFDFLVVNVDVVDVNVVGEDVVAVIVICLFAYFSSGFVLFFLTLMAGPVLQFFSSCFIQSQDHFSRLFDLPLFLLHTSTHMHAHLEHIFSQNTRTTSIIIGQYLIVWRVIFFSLLCGGFDALRVRLTSRSDPAGKKLARAEEEGCWKHSEDFPLCGFCLSLYPCRFNQY